MGRGITKRLLDDLWGVAAGLPDKREASNGRKYGIAPAGLHGVFNRVLEAVREEGVVESYRVLNGTIPVALDGTWYFSSEEIHRDHCLTMEKKNLDGSTETLPP
jgi:hypothetical protein